MLPTAARGRHHNTPLADRTAEMAVIGCMLLDPELDDPRLGVGTFTGTDTARVYEAILSMRVEDAATSDPVSVAQRLADRGWLEDIPGGVAGIADYMATPGELASYGSYVDRLIHLQAQREAALALESAMRMLTAPGADLHAAALALDGIRDELAASRTSGYLSPAELVAAHPDLPRPVIHGLLRAGEVANLIGGSKSQKSWAVLQLAICGAIGMPWLGRYEVEAGPVLLIDAELRLPVLASRLRTVADAMAVSVSWLGQRLLIRALRGERADLLSVLAHARRMRPAPSLLIVDPLYRLLPAGVDENSNHDIAHLYSAIDQTAERIGCGVVVVHHSSKGAQADKRVTDVGAGAGAASRAVDAHLVMREHEDPDCVALDAVVRSFPRPEPVVLRWCFPLWRPDEDLDPARLRGASSPADQRQADRDAVGIRKIVETLRRGPATARKIQDTTGISRCRLARLLASLVEAGDLQSADRRIRGNDCLEYRLTDVSDESPPTLPASPPTSSDVRARPTPVGGAAHVHVTSAASPSVGGLWGGASPTSTGPEMSGGDG
ncbi:MAG: AAA family ATPase [Planctomyces sp.]|nr:AAA family ATPase [Planctomyces sp.]